MHETPSITATSPTATTTGADLGAVHPLLVSPAFYLEDEEGAMIDRMILAGLVTP